MSLRERLFDALRSIKEGGLSQGEVNAFDDLFDEMGLPESAVEPDAPSACEASGAPVQTSGAGIALIHSFEGYARQRPDGSVEAYPDPGTGAAPWTIGWGSTTDENGKSIKPGTIWSRERADKRFVQHLGQFEREVIAALGDAAEATSQAQFDALVSFAYNVGSANLRRSTLLRKHKAGDYAGAAREFARWNRAAGRALPGLTRRRAAEAKMYRGGI